MIERQLLVELLRKARYGSNKRTLGQYFPDSCLERIADHLLANGVTVKELALPEEDYYVLRNAETGMYFRGKGVNGWGKHFNQATIYRVKGTAERSIREVAWNGEKAQLVRIKIVEMPEPPKEEV